ncbi:hypothetical protein FZC76_07005 [Sutcliffiella horikoshii]|uniref:Uncharacterized protein n=1 Tax=Sutcliffiella horikoshii TaxID=79883 RepID=A0A5D4SZ07_9BACI|nr:hypothetical protein [Sutcliffiella horikoshii]TYS68687.1 hypothetical protein FZC76_07005 [Sutcliffiella horikoshii]
MNEKVIYGSSELRAKFDGEIVSLEQELDGEVANQIFMYEDEFESVFEIVKGVSVKELTRIIARNLVAWDTSKDKREGLLPEVYLFNKHIYKLLTGEEYYKHKAVKKFNIE